MDGVIEANAQASVEGTTTVRMICRCEAPRKRAEWIRSASTQRAPWNVLKKTMKNTIVHARTIFARSPTPKPQSVDCTVESAMAQIESRASPPARYAKRRRIIEGRLMKNGSIQ